RRAWPGDPRPFGRRKKGVDARIASGHDEDRETKREIRNGRNKGRSTLALTLATWNINSVRLRLDLVRRFIDETKPDVLCLQETKTPDEHFPREAFAALGYRDMLV